MFDAQASTSPAARDRGRGPSRQHNDGGGQEDRPADVKILQANVVLQQGAGKSYPTWLFRIGARNAFRMDVFN